MTGQCIKNQLGKAYCWSGLLPGTLFGGGSSFGHRGSHLRRRPTPLGAEGLQPASPEHRHAWLRDKSGWSRASAALWKFLFMVVVGKHFAFLLIVV